MTTPAANPRVEFVTNLGRFTVELAADKAPKTVENFLQYVDDGFYAGTIFHRVIDGFMVQGGGMTADMSQKKTRGPIPIESNNGLKNKTGTIAMARTNDPNSATAQFFVNVNDNDFLDYPGQDGHGYTVFGAVVEGMDTINAIRKVRTRTAGFHRDVPADTVTIESATRA